MLKILTDKQVRFCEEYLLDLNATQAAIRAGYKEKTARAIGCENLTKESIIDYIERIKPEVLSKIREKRNQKVVDGIGYLYLVRCIGTHYYKIGVAKNSISERLRCLQISVPFDLELIKSFEKKKYKEVEKDVHRYFDDYRIRGEWFSFSPKIIMKVIRYMETITAENDLLIRKVS